MIQGFWPKHHLTIRNSPHFLFHDFPTEQVLGLVTFFRGGQTYFRRLSHNRKSCGLGETIRLNPLSSRVSSSGGRGIHEDHLPPNNWNEIKKNKIDIQCHGIRLHELNGMDGRMNENDWTNAYLLVENWRKLHGEFDVEGPGGRKIAKITFFF